MPMESGRYQAELKLLSKLIWVEIISSSFWDVIYYARAKTLINHLSIYMIIVIGHDLSIG